MRKAAFCRARRGGDYPSRVRYCTFRVSATTPTLKRERQTDDCVLEVSFLAGLPIEEKRKRGQHGLFSFFL